MPIKPAVAALALLAATLTGCSSTGSTDGGINFTSVAPTAPTVATDAGYLNPDTLSAAVQDSYQSSITGIDSTVTVTATCIPKPEPRTFSCLIELSTGQTASHDVLVDQAGDNWVTTN